MKAYVQHKHGQPTNANTFNAAEGFRAIGIEVEPFEAEALENLPLTPETIVCGYVGVVHRALDRLGVARPQLHPAPPELQRFYGREVWSTTLGEIRALPGPVFVKPLTQHKEFTGHVRRGELDDLNRTAHLDDDFAVLASEVLDMQSEWRCFVHGGRCVGARPYAGPVLPVSPDWSVLAEVLAVLDPRAPIACSIDLAVTPHGTVVVERNDAYALGSYGLPAIPYAQLLEARWTQLVDASAG